MSFFTISCLELNVAEKVSTVDLKVPNARFESITLREGEALVLDDLDAMVIPEGNLWIAGSALSFISSGPP